MSDATRANYGTHSRDCQPKPAPLSSARSKVSRRSAFAPAAVNPGPSKMLSLTCTACGHRVVAIIEFMDPDVIHYAGICENCYGQECETIIR